jgi:hypothetical protein
MSYIIESTGRSKGVLWRQGERSSSRFAFGWFTRVCSNKAFRIWITVWLEHPIILFSWSDDVKYVQYKSAENDFFYIWKVTVTRHGHGSQSKLLFHRPIFVADEREGSQFFVVHYNTTSHPVAEERCPKGVLVPSTHRFGLVGHSHRLFDSLTTTSQTLALTIRLR